MRSQKRTQTGVGTSAWLPFDNACSPFNVSVACLVSGTATYTVQYTFDNVARGDTARSFNHPDMTAQTISKDSNFMFPVMGARVDVTAGSGTVEMITIQAGSGA